jgi:tetratricopeptide (TPR) repeat protein
MHAWRKGQTSEALEHMAEAIRLDPNFVEAQTEAGAIYAVSGKLELALDYFNRALALEPTWAPPNAGKASVLVMLNRDQEAEQAARAALQYDPGSIPAHYMLGIALVRQGKNTREAVVHLKVAADKFPTARAFLAAAEAELAKKQD